MGFDEFPKGLSPQEKQLSDHRRAASEISDDVYDFRHFAEHCLKSVPGFVSPSELYASLCDLAANHPVYLTDNEEAQDQMDRWNEVSVVEHDGLPMLEATIRAARQA